MVNVICENCGQLYDLPEGESIEKYECEYCNGNLKYQKGENSHTIDNEYKQSIISYRKLHTVKMEELFKYGMIIIGIFILLVILEPLITSIIRLQVVPILFLIYILMPGVPLFLFSKNQYDRWHKGAEGEKLVAKKLNQLPEDYYVFNDVTIPTLKGNIDHVVVGPSGIFALETKNHKAKYTIWGEQWVKSGLYDRKVRNNPGRQAQRNAKGLMKYLSHKGIRGVKWITSMVILVNDDYEIKKNPRNYVVLKPSELNDYIMNKNQQIKNKNTLGLSLILKEHCAEFSYYDIKN